MKDYEVTANSLTGALQFEPIHDDRRYPTVVIAGHDTNPATSRPSTSALKEKKELNSADNETNEVMWRIQQYASTMSWC